MSKQKYSNLHKVNKKNEEIVRSLVKAKASNDSEFLNRIHEITNTHY